MRNLSVSLAVSLLIAGCGGGGSDSNTSPVATAQSSVKDPLTIFTGTSYDAGDGALNPRWVIGDFNKDGVKDIFLRYDPISAFSNVTTGNSPVRFFLGKSNGGFDQDKNIFPEGYSPTLVNRIVAGDFNGDGGTDILVATAGQDPYVNGLPAQTGYTGEMSQVLTYTPNGYKLSKINNNINAFAHHASTGDINGDYLPDMFVTSLVFSSPFFIMGDSNGNYKVDRARFPSDMFGAQKIVLEKFLNSSNKKWENLLFTSTALVDVNNDGHQDIALMAMSGTKTSVVLLNDGAGNFSSTRMMELPAGPYGAGYAYKNNGNDTKCIEVGTIHLDTIVADINNDGKKDIISLTTNSNVNDQETIYYRGASLQILINNGNGFTDESKTRTNFTHVSSKNYTHYDTIEFVDVNNDKCTDILLHRGQVNLNDSAMPTRILLNDCKGNFTEVSYPKNLPIGILTVLGDGNYAILISQKNGNTYTQRVDHVKYDWAMGKSLFN
jgi:hypothetical protein